MERRDSPAILLVDDDDRTRLRYAEALRRADFNVVEVRGWQAARDALTTTPPRIVVASFDPDGRDDCFTFCRKVKHDQRSRDVPILLLAPDTTREDLKLAIGAGVLLVTLHQPDTTKLVAAVTGVLAAQGTPTSAADLIRPA